MEKLFLLSVIIAMMAFPLAAARDRSPRRGLIKALAWTVSFNLLYALGIVLVLPSLR